MTDNSQNQKILIYLQDGNAITALDKIPQKIVK